MPSVSGLDDAQIRGDARGGQRVVAGDHHRANPGAMRLGHAGTDLGARRVDDADHASPDQSGLNRLALLRDVRHLPGGVRTHARHIGQRLRFQRSVGLPQRAIGLRGEAFDRGQYGLAIAVGQPPHRIPHGDMRAVAQQHVGRSFGEHGEFAGIGVVLGDDRHALAFGGEGNLGDALEIREARHGLDLAGRDNKRHLGGVAHGLPGAVRVA